MILGGIFGWIADRRPSGEGMFAGWRRWAVLAWGVGFLVALLHWLPGRAGFWLETALLFFAAYAIGCLIGGWIRSMNEKPMAAGASAPGSAAKSAAALGAAGAAAAGAKTAAAAPVFFLPHVLREPPRAPT